MIEPLSKSKASVVRALHRRKGRREHGAFLAEGERTLHEFARAGIAPRFVFGRGEQLNYLRSLFPESPTFFVDERSNDVFATETSQGLAAVFDIPAAVALDDIARRNAPILALDAVSDPGNLGSIVRSGEWFGIAAIVLMPGCADAYGPKAVRASMGSLVRIAVIEATLEQMMTFGRQLFALDARGSRILGVDTLPRNAIYIVGSEAHGISGEVALASEAIAIRGTGEIESLNAAMSASILCYELSRNV